MSAHSCCGGPRRPRAGSRRGGEIAGWLISGLVLALMPKCPACLAAYVAIASGIGLSVTTAAHLRLAILILCAASLILLAGIRARRLVEARTLISSASPPAHRGRGGRRG